MRVLTGPEGQVVPNLYCIGDANGKMMLAHTASAQGISAIENICGNAHVVNHDAIPAACFTHPEIAFVGLNEEQAKERASSQGFEVGKATGHFRANSKALAEAEGEGIAKVLFRKDTEQILGVHIIGLHAADLIQECANAVAAGTSVRELSMMVKLFLTAWRFSHTAKSIGAYPPDALRGSRRGIQICGWYGSSLAERETHL